MQLQRTAAPHKGQGIRFTTYHGLLVAWGQVAQWLKLPQVLAARLHIQQKTVVHSPVAKVIEALVGILAGCRYMKDLNHAASPLVTDRAVCRSWGLPGFAHFSTVCRTLGAFRTANVQELTEAIGSIMRPLLRARAEAVAGPGRRHPLFIDVDLSGQKVRGETRQYTGTAFGYIQGTLARGYQIAAAFLSTRKLRLAIAGRLKPGDAAAAPCLLELLPEIEARIGRPRRRVEWLRDGIAGFRQELEQCAREWAALSGKGIGARRKALAGRMERIKEQIVQYEARLAGYEQENAANPRPFRMVIRADSAFGTTAVIQHLLEMGYNLVLKRHTICSFRRLWDEAPASAWVVVGKKRQASEHLPLPPLTLPVPFPVRQVALRRWDVDKREVRSVIVTTFTAEEASLGDVVACYEARQSIEAGFQECKGAFHFGHPRLRKYEANAAFLQLVLFAFNLIRWAWLWMETNSERLRGAGSKMLLQIAAVCRATVWFTGGELTIRYSRRTGLGGVKIRVPAPTGDLLDSATDLFAQNPS